MLALNGAVRLVALQFSFSNPDAIPKAVKCLEPETPDEWSERKSRSTGLLVILPTDNCSVAEFAGELEAAGYEMVDAFYKERIDLKDPRGERSYHMVQFLFARSEFVKLSEKSKKVRNVIRTALSEMCRVAMWRLRAFSNPLYKNGEEIAGQRALSINLEARKPLFRPNDQPVTVWQKDEKGERVGDAPLPLKADWHLRIVSKAVQLV